MICVNKGLFLFIVGRTTTDRFERHAAVGVRLARVSKCWIWRQTVTAPGADRSDTETTRAFCPRVFDRIVLPDEMMASLLGSFARLSDTASRLN